MSIRTPIYVPPKTRSWATSAIILGSIFLLMSFSGYFSYHRSMAMFGSKAAITLLINFIDQVISIVFIAAGAAVLRGRTWGREGLTYASAAAIVLTVLSTVWSFLMLHDPAYIANMNRANAAAASALPANFMTIMMTIIYVASSIMAVIQITYCVLLYRHMSAEPAAEPLPYGSPTGMHDSGIWPPPPAG